MTQAIVSFLLQKLAATVFENASQKLKLVTGVDKEVKTLQRNFKAIHDVLEDADERQVVEKSVKEWLNNLKDAAYDMEDVLDEWFTALSKSKLQKDEDESELESASLSKMLVCPFIACFSFVHEVAKLVCDPFIPSFSFGHEVAERHDIGLKIKEINEKLDTIAKQKDRYGFTKRKTRHPRQINLTTSFVDVSQIRGREKIKDDIVKTLSSPSMTDGCIETISIVGMGGIGKTGLAQLVFDNVTRKECFDKTIWICVSDVFDQTRIAREILEGLDGRPPDLQMSLQGLLCKIREKIKTTNFFFVFDDVWTEDDKNWEELRAAIQHCERGGRILVTTRKEHVADVMRSSDVIRLELLPDEVCWDILKQVAFIGRDESKARDFEDIGMEIAKKCKGLPLAAKTLGSLLRHKRKRDEWQKVANSRFWELNLAEQHIFRPLLLSYNELPPKIKQCLLYCAVFPKDHVMSKEELILHWGAQGFLKLDEEMESKGEEYFYDLASRSFFQDFVKDTSGNVYKCKMHDLIHDFLQFLTKDEIVARISSLSRKTHHLTITYTHFPDCINRVEKLRTLLAAGFNPTTGLSEAALCNLFNNAKRLRLLEFVLGTSRMGNIENFPKEIGNLVHLRYLKISHGFLRELPESVCELHNLHYLDLSYVHLTKLPNEMEKLINLKYLYTIGCKIDRYPKGIGKLTGLRRLDRIAARIDHNDPAVFSVGDLEKLNLLCGDLQLHMVGDTINKNEAERAKLNEKAHLTKLSMTLMRSRKRPDEHQAMKDNVTKALKPPSSLCLEWMVYNEWQGLL